MHNNNGSWSVYIHTSPSGKKYVGITSQHPERRWLSGHGYRQHKRFMAAIKKYGWGNIDHEVVARGLSKEDAIELERRLISEYDSTSRERGYNCSPGGESGASGIVMSRETREKMSKSHSGKKHSKEWNENVSKARVGKTFTEEHKRNVSKAMSEKWKDNEYRTMMQEAHSGRNSHKAQKVLCVETGEVFECIKYACEKYHLHSSAVSNVCRGKLKTTGGYHWEYIN